MTQRARRVVKPPQTRRDEVVAAAVRLFKAHGFHETTVQDLARAAGVAIGTVYVYFPSKEHVLVECHRRLREGLGTLMAATLTDAFTAAPGRQPVDLNDLLDELLDAAVGYIRANRDLCEVCLKFTPPADPYHDAAGAFLQPLTEAIAKGARHDRISVSDPSATAYLLGAALGGTLCTSVVYGSPPLDRLIPAAKELFLRTLDPAGER